MERITTLILSGLVGFYGIALCIDEPELLIFKSKVFFCGVLVVWALKMADNSKKN